MPKIIFKSSNLKDWLERVNKRLKDSGSPNTIEFGLGELLLTYPDGINSFVQYETELED